MVNLSFFKTEFKSAVEASLRINKLEIAVYNKLKFAPDFTSFLDRA